MNHEYFSKIFKKQIKYALHQQVVSSPECSRVLHLLTGVMPWRDWHQEGGPGHGVHTGMVPGVSAPDLRPGHPPRPPICSNSLYSRLATIMNEFTPRTHPHLTIIVETK